MNLNKRLFKEILTTTILRKHRHKMVNLEHFYRTRNVGLDKNTPVEEYGIKWDGGCVFLRRYINDNNVEISANIGSQFDSVEINYYDVDGDDFITSNKTLIKEMINCVEGDYYLNSNYEV